MANAVERTVGHEFEPTGGGVAPDDVFEVLRNDRRRRVLKFLDIEPETSTSVLAVHLASVENDVRPEEVDSAMRKRTYVSLYQVHLPKLESAGAIEYDTDRGTVAATEDLPRFLEALDGSDGSQARSLFSNRRTIMGTGLLVLAATAELGFVLSGGRPTFPAVLVALLVLLGLGLIWVDAQRT